MTGVKMISCCYCGARDVFRVGKGKRVMLSCLSCGAPVRKMEVVRNDAPSEPGPVRVPERVNKHRKSDHYSAIRKRKKKRKSLISRVWDKVDDVFDLDDIFDFD